MNDWAPVFGIALWVWLFVMPIVFAILSYFFQDQAKRLLTPLWRILDRIYLASGAIAAAFMVVILITIILQMIARWSSISFQGSTEFAGYAMAATSFFAFAYALNSGSHIRVSIILNINNFTRKWVDAYAIMIAAVTATYFARYAVKTNYMSEMLNDRTQGQDQVPEWVLALFSMAGTWPTNWAEIWTNTSSDWVYTPVWLPQLPMSIGASLLAIALWDNLFRLLINGESNIKGEVVE
jgi:TRAP-type C4-dicarboxylate transport system permease small subunit